MTKQHLLLTLTLAAFLGAPVACDSSSGSNSDDVAGSAVDTAGDDTSSDPEGTGTGDKGTSSDSNTHTENTDAGGTDTGTHTGAQDTGTGTANTDTGHSDTGTGTGTGIDTDDIDTNVSIDCDVPKRYLEPPVNDNGDIPGSWITFQFEGALNLTTADAVQPGTGHINAVLRGNSLDLNDRLVAYFSYSSSLVYIEGTSEPEADGSFYFVQIRIEVDDLIYLEEHGKKTINITEDSYPGTEVRLYSGQIDESGDLVKACQEAKTRYDFDVQNEADRHPTEYYVCNTAIDFMTNEGESFPVAGRARLFDDADELAEIEGMRCSCDNGAGGWRNCDKGIPDAYGLMRFGFKTGQTEDAYWTKYVYDDSKLWKLGQLNKEYVLAHPEGYWQEGIGFANGGLNIGPYVPSLDPQGDWLYGFGIRVPAGAVAIGLAGHRSDIEKVVLYEQSFDSRDGDPQVVGFWVNIFVPDSLQTGDSLAFGAAEHEGQLFVYDHEDPNNCIMAAACGGAPVDVVRAENLKSAEGGQLQLRSTQAEVSGHTTRYTVTLYHPSQMPSNCDWDTYLEEAGQPVGVAVCPKW